VISNYKFNILLFYNNMSGQKIYFQSQPKTVNNFLQNNNVNNINNNLPTTTTTTTSSTTNQPIILNNVNGETGLLRNTLTNNYGLFLQPYLPGSTLSLNYGVIAETAGVPYILTQNYSMIPTIKSSNIYNV
jgi:hypothetical protein